jgi:ABC transporter DrrB family efflux protein
MTALATDVARDATSTAPPIAATPGARFATATGQSARRTALQYLRTPQLVVLPTILGALFLLIFRYIFGGAIQVSGRLDYVDFLVPGFLATVVFWTGMNAPAGIAEDAASGVHDRFRSLPIPRAAVMTGRSLADSALSTWVLLVATALGFAVGFHTHAEIGSVALAFGLMLLGTYVFTWMFIALGLVAGNAQAAQGMASLLVIPLTFLSSAYVPVSSMPGWMEPFAANQPVTVVINAVRSLMLGGADAAGLGHTTAHWVVLSLVWLAGIFVVTCSFAVARFARTR